MIDMVLENARSSQIKDRVGDGQFE
jgi:hypothetical protein